LHRRLAISGWILYLISWVTPSWQEGRIGAQAFLATLQYAARFLLHPHTALQFVLGLCLLLGWLANFSIGVPLSARTRLAWILAPWLPFLAVLLLMEAPLAVRERIFSELYFYPWAIGIAAIHLAMIWRERRQQATGAA
jgi:hypothetical protein